MKNVVMGLFDRLEDAEAVIAQLAASPLDLESIQVIHADTAVQRRLGLQAGIPPRRAVRTGAVLGALVGAALGFAGGGSAFTEGGPGPLASLGPLLAMSIGAVLGLLLGALAGAVSDRLRIPGGHAAEVVAAIDAGATAVTVRTENLPTAKAIGDLFQRSGSKVLSSGSEAVAGGGDGAAFAFDPEASPTDPAAVPEAHAAFAPPWRREEPVESDVRGRAAETPPSAAIGDDDAPPSLPELDGDLLFPSASPRAGETTASSPGPTPEDEARSAALPRTIRRGETVSTPDRTTQEVLPRDHAAPSGAGSARGSDPASTMPDAPASLRGNVDAADASASRPRAAQDETAQPLEALSMSPRVLGALHKAGIRDVAALRTLAAEGDAMLTALPGIGPAALMEVKRVLASAPAPTRERDVATAPPDAAPPTTQAQRARMTSDPATAPVEKRGAPRSKPAPRSAVDAAAETVLREIFGSASGRDA